MSSKIINFHNLQEYNLIKGNTVKIPVFRTPVWAGLPTDFPDMGNEPFSGNMDIPREYVKNPNQTYVHKIKGDSMEPLLKEGDNILVDCSDSAIYSGILDKVVLAYIDGGLNVKRLKKVNEKLYLVPENPSYPTKEVTEDSGFKVWGVVLGVSEFRKIK